jgi:hypothetical protein
MEAQKAARGTAAGQSDKEGDFSFVKDDAKRKELEAMFKGYA